MSQLFVPAMKASSEIRQPAEIAGKFPHLWCSPNFDEPS